MPLSASWRTAVYDHPGTGETVVTADKITHEALVDDVFRVMDATGVTRLRAAVTAVPVMNSRRRMFSPRITPRVLCQKTLGAAKTSAHGNRRSEVHRVDLATRQ